METVLTKVWYFIGNMIGLLTTLALIFVLFLDIEGDFITDRKIIFLVWINIISNLSIKDIKKEK